MKDAINILGIDPGTGRTGWGVIIKKGENGMSRIEYTAHGCVTTEQDMQMSKRLLVLHEKLLDLIDIYQPDCIIVEHIFFARNVKTAISVAQARGIVLMSAAKYNIPTFEYTPGSVKLMLAGSGRSDKKEVQKAVRRILGKNSVRLSFNSKDKGFDDAADALAIAIHHALKMGEQKSES